QFDVRRRQNRHLLTEFEHILTGYFFSDKPRTVGLPTVAYCAEQMHLSPNYFGDLIKRETGTSPQEFIQATIVNVAKSLIFDPQKTILDISEELGFQYPQHFTTMFKRRTGMTPTQYRKLKKWERAQDRILAAGRTVFASLRESLSLPAAVRETTPT
ncbi:helix-turn-helix transcriptional regulator, partial [Mesomycoplasma ovipneumoniae]|uniref:helix-turn-helix domain-containing protein n=1 Tax=Mesomycoplasma ovipneumoniae TaxID=29562 RepID=UPI00308104A9